jgi:endonuclease/exonuclease/phosphatase (EEP) superfamily protein YafD
VFLASLAGLTLAYRVLGDTTLLGECLTVWPPALWCAVLAPRLALVAWRGRRRETAAAAGVMAAFLAATTEWRSLLPRPRSPLRERFDRARRSGDPRALRVVSWNVAGRLPLDDLAPLEPDLVLVQEAPLGDVSLEGAWSRYRWATSFDPAALSRHPVRVLPSRRVGPWQEPQLVALEPPGAPPLLVANVRLVLPSFVIAVAAGEWPWRLAGAHAERLAQYRLLAELIAETTRREGLRHALLCGDFNTPGGALSLRPLAAAGLRDVWPQAGRGWGATMTAELPVSRIDQCWTSASLAPASASVRSGRSDHRMLVLDLLLPD